MIDNSKLGTNVFMEKTITRYQSDLAVWDQIAFSEFQGSGLALEHFLAEHTNWFGVRGKCQT
jgi:hypothetical protein